MSTERFKVIEHKIPCQHIREYPHALANSQEDVLYLAVKQYVPLDNLNPQPGDVTIIGAHANGFPKELYEPLWDDLLLEAGKCKVKIRGIWIADVAQQGQSGVLNENILGNDPSWSDHPRDLLHMINLKRDEIRRPIVGIGHSMGGNNLQVFLWGAPMATDLSASVNIAYMHPRLFTSLVLLDPVIHLASSTPPELGPNPAMLSTYRRDIWPSREAAAESFKKSPFYQRWEPRVLDKWLQYGLRDLPTPLYPDIPPGDGKTPVTLTTTKHQEVFTFLRPNYEGYGVHKQVNRKTHADLNPDISTIYPFYRAEPPRAYQRLPELRPGALYIFGGKSEINAEGAPELKVKATGIGVGGSGGVEAGRVKGVTFEDIGHLIPMEATNRTAVTISEWLQSEMQLWQRDEEEFQRAWSQMSGREKRTIDKKWIEMTGPLPRRKQNPPKL